LGGKVFKNFQPRIHRIPFDEFKLTSDMRIFTSVDSGWVHPTGWLWHAVTPTGEIITFFEMRDSYVNIEGWSQRVKSFEKSLKYADTGQRASIYLRTGDPALRQTRANTGISDIGEYAKHGIYLAVEGVPTGPGSVDTGLRKFDEYLKINPVTHKPTWRYVENCTQLEDEMLKYHWETWASKKLESKNAPKVAPHKKHDDLCDSLRYFITTQPDLSFDDSVPTKQVTDRLGAVADIPFPFTDTPNNGEKEYRDFGSLEGDSGYILHDEYSSWEMEW
jgi:hypothetical protein